MTKRSGKGYPMSEQLDHYSNKLAYETGSWELKAALEAGEDIVVIDARSPEAHERERIPGPSMSRRGA